MPDQDAWGMMRTPFVDAIVRWWNRRKLKVELPKPERRRCWFCGADAAWFCNTHKEFTCTHHLGDIHDLSCEMCSWATYLDAVTGKVR